MPEKRRKKSSNGPQKLLATDRGGGDGLKSFASIGYVGGDPEKEEIATPPGEKNDETNLLHDFPLFG